MKMRQRALDRWVTATRAGWGDQVAATAESLRPLLVEWHDRPDLRLVGRTFADRHHSLTQAIDCLHLLGSVANRRVRNRLLDQHALVEVATGWADASIERANVLGRVAPIEMLLVRLRQHYQISQQLGADPAAHAALVVVESVHDVDSAKHDVVLRHVVAQFCAGETIAVSPSGTVLVLAVRSSSLAPEAAHLTQTLRADLELSGCDLHVWIEPIGQTVDTLEAHLADLTL
jgi:hypothetical protein